MGFTTILGTENLTPTEFVEQRVIPELSQQREVIGVSVRSKVVYLAVHTPQKLQTVAVVAVLEKGEDGWSYKAIAEAEGPHYYDCPSKILTKLSATACATSNEWRYRCRERIEERSAKARQRKLLHYGTVITLQNAITFSDGVTESVFTCVTRRINGRSKKLFVRKKDQALCHISGLCDLEYTIS